MAGVAFSSSPPPPQPTRAADGLAEGCFELDPRFLVGLARGALVLLTDMATVGVARWFGVAACVPEGSIVERAGSCCVWRLVFGFNFCFNGAAAPTLVTIVLVLFFLRFRVSTTAVAAANGGAAVCSGHGRGESGESGIRRARAALGAFAALHFSFAVHVATRGAILKRTAPPAIKQVAGYPCVNTCCTIYHAVGL